MEKEVITQIRREFNLRFQSVAEEHKRMRENGLPKIVENDYEGRENGWAYAIRSLDRLTDDRILNAMNGERELWLFLLGWATGLAEAIRDNELKHSNKWTNQYHHGRITAFMEIVLLSDMKLTEIDLNGKGRTNDDEKND